MSFDVDAYQREYYQRNKEQKCAYRKAHYRANKERTLAVNQAYREKNPELIARLKKEWADANKPRLMARMTERRRAQPKSIRQLEGAKYRMKRGNDLRRSQAEYYRQNRDQILAYSKRRREGDDRESILRRQKTQFIRQWLIRAEWTWDEYDIRYSQGCEICGGHGGGTPKTGLCFDHDHATGVVRGLLCGRCNRFLDWAIGYHAEIGVYHARATVCK